MAKTSAVENLTQELRLGNYQKKADAALEKLRRDHFMRRFWAKDASLWKTDPKHVAIIKNSLGWQKVAEWVEARLEELTQFAGTVKSEGFTDVVLLGMGGSSLAPEVFRRSLSAKKGYPELHVLDSTDPGWVSQVEKSVTLSKTLFVVASKSGSTIEPLSFYNYFYDRAKRNGAQFVAITDPGSYLEGVAKEKGFKKIFLNPSDIGGRFSALSYFGIVPAALAGMDVEELLARAIAMGENASANTPIQDNQPAVLGAVIGELAKAGRDKVTLVLPESIESFGLWVEQLVAESSGKEGRGIVPIAGESLGGAEIYGGDRLFVAVSEGKFTKALDAKLTALEKRHPVVRIQIEDSLDIGAEMLRWEIATSVACSILGVNTFDQPDVQSAKDVTKEILKDLSAQSSLALPKPHLDFGTFSATFSKASRKAADAGDEKKVLRKFFAQAEAGDYIGLLAYIPFTVAADKALTQLRETLRNGAKRPTLFGYGPRYLHSTGQLHKGGANNGVFAIVTMTPEADINVPTERFTFGQLEMAQALGDFRALEAKGRRAVWIHLKAAPAATIGKIALAVRGGAGSGTSD